MGFPALTGRVDGVDVRGDTMSEGCEGEGPDGDDLRLGRSSKRLHPEEAPLRNGPRDGVDRLRRDLATTDSEKVKGKTGVGTSTLSTYGPRLPRGRIRTRHGGNRKSL